MKRREKKSETLEVRMPHSKKQAFMEACERNGITASHAVRRFIDAYVARSNRVSLKQIIKDLTMTANRHRMKLTGMMTAVIAATIGFGALPSTAEGDAFGKLDSNGDGYITSDEIGGDGGMVIEILDTDGDNRVSPDEFEAARVVKMDGEHSVAFKAGDESTDEDGKTMKREVFIVKAEDGTSVEDLEKEIGVWIGSTGDEDIDFDFDTVDIRGEEGGKKVIKIQRKVEKTIEKTSEE